MLFLPPASLSCMLGHTILPFRYYVSGNYIPAPPSSFTVTHRLLWMRRALCLFTPHYRSHFTIISSRYTSSTIAQRHLTLNLWLSYAHHSLTNLPCYEIILSISWCRHSLPHAHLVLSSQPPLSASIRHTQSSLLHHNNVHYYRYSNLNNYPLR